MIFQILLYEKNMYNHLFELPYVALYLVEICQVLNGLF